MIVLRPIDRAVWQTVIYFDLFDFPVTATEVYKYLISNQPFSFEVVEATLKQLVNEKKLSLVEGFYCLPDKNSLINKRKENYLTADDKFKIALTNIKLLARMPFVKAVFVTGSLSYSNAKPSGDIDLAIITKPGRIWTARFFCATLMKLLNRRPMPGNKKNKICLSFYATTDHLNLESTALENDLHYAMWMSQFVPVYDPENLYDQFWQENSWIKKILPNVQAYGVIDRRKIKNKPWLAYVSQVKGIVPESVYKKLQMKVMPNELKEMAKQSKSNVILSDRLLKLHTTDKRAEYNQEWTRRCQQIIPNFDLKTLWQALSKIIQS